MKCDICQGPLPAPALICWSYHNSVGPADGVYCSTKCHHADTKEAREARYAEGRAIERKPRSAGLLAHFATSVPVGIWVSDNEC